MDAFLGRGLAKVRDELKSSTSKNSKLVVKSCTEALGKQNPIRVGSGGRRGDILMIICFAL
jgi:hypothetical protein